MWCPHLLLSAGACRRYRSTAGTWRPISDAGPRLHLAANQPHAAAAVDRRDRQTDGRTSDRYIDPVPHIKRAASITYTWSAGKPNLRRWQSVGSDGKAGLYEGTGKIICLEILLKRG